MKEHFETYLKNGDADALISKLNEAQTNSPTTIFIRFNKAPYLYSISEIVNDLNPLTSTKRNRDLLNEMIEDAIKSNTLEVFR